MQTYIVIFASPDRAPALRAHIKSINGWAKITDNAWVVVTSKTATQIRDELVAIKGAGDRIFVVRSGTVAAWSNIGPSTSEWLKKYL